MTNPGEDAGQTASSDSSGEPSEPASSGYEAPSIEQSQDNTAQSGQSEPTPADPPSYAPPQAYPSPPGYEAPGYPQQPGYPPPDYAPPPTEYPAPGAAQPAYPPPPYPGPPGYPPPQFGTPQYGAPPAGYPPPPAGYGPPPTGYPAPDYLAYGPSQKTNPFAIASLVASLVGFIPFCFFGVGSLIGIALGIVALNQIKQNRESGRGLAIAGIIVGAVSLLASLVWSILMFSS